ncbi:hypothetical protein DFH28DRAFT_1120822 [Melampsora americana]|nr:hypothetical protein DFH28DRAFT_1120822 [Melampsora americana]
MRPNEITSSHTQCDTVVGIIEKYGLVPKSIYDESYNSSNSGEINTFLTYKLCNIALELLQIHNNAKGRGINDLGQDFRSAIIFGVKAAQKTKKGSPSPSNKAFRWEYLDKSYHAPSLLSTPFDLYHKHCDDFQPSEYISFLNDPRNLYDKVWGGLPIRYVNTSTDVLKTLVIKMIQVDLAVWFDYQAAFGVMSHLSKSERFQMLDSAITHAMVITAVHLDEEDKPVRYKVENNWSDTAGDRGYLVMTDAWFDEYVYQIVIPKSFTLNFLRQIYDDSEPRVLPP